MRNLVPKESGVLLRTITRKEDSWFKRTNEKTFEALPFKNKYYN